MQQKKVSFKQRLEYALFAGTISLIKHSPRAVLDLEKNILIFLLKSGSPRHRRQVTRNLAQAFPTAAPSRLVELKNKIYSHFGRVFIEIASTFARKDPQSILSRVRVNHMEILERVLEKKRGVIVFSAHFGNWEWIPLILHNGLHQEIHSIARPMDNPLIENKVREFREAMGSNVIYKQGSLRTILQRLKRNGIIYLLIDQNTVTREGVFVDFFGTQAATITTVSQLYLKKDVPLLPVFLHYENKEIVLDILPEIDYATDRNHPAAITELTQQLTGLIEAQVRKFPEQWFWFHDRWKTRPQGDKHENQ
jgi:KDO2-lipid IV(A) lauroyltransferase